MKNIDLIIEHVDQEMKSIYGRSIHSMEITNTPGFWRDKKERRYPGHPLHGCLGNEGLFKATYYLSEPGRDEKGRFLRPFRAWETIKKHVDNTQRSEP